MDSEMETGIILGIIGFRVLGFGLVGVVRLEEF